MYAQDSIDLLAKSGIDFSQHEKNGVDATEFAEWLMTSGIVLNEEVRWITFHSGHDFGYLLKILTCQPLPSSEDDFLSLLQLYFPCIYDIKFLMEQTNLHGGLSKVAEQLGVRRIGPQHQAGSDSLLTAAVFFKLHEQYFNGDTNPLWAETDASRNAVRRETILPPQPGAGGGGFAVLTNTDRMSEFDAKFLGMLFGLNNDYTIAWKKKEESARLKRARKESSIANGELVSSDEEEETPLDGATRTSSMSSSSPVFVPGQQLQPAIGSGGNPYVPLTPQKQSLHSHHSSNYTASPSANEFIPGSASKLPKHPSTATTANGYMRTRYTHDYS